MADGWATDGAAVHPLALCETEDVGPGCVVGAFAHILPGTRLGSGVAVGEHARIGAGVVVGDRVTVGPGANVRAGTVLAEDVRVGPGVVFADDPLPGARAATRAAARTDVRSGVTIGGGAVVLPGVRLGVRAHIGAGAVVTEDVPPEAVVVGNPARIVGYVEDSRAAAPSSAANAGDGRVTRLTRADDLRGSLVAIELTRDLPFVPQRFFAVFGVPSRDLRGEHAHRVCDQFLVCLAGSATCLADDGHDRVVVTLDRPEHGLFLPAMTWGVQYNFSPDAVLGVFASHPYDGADYIRDYDEFLAELARR